MKAKFKRGSSGVFKDRARDLRRALPALAAQGARTAELHAKRGLVVNIYGTERGKYSRTRKLLQQVYAQGHASGTSLGIQVGDNAEYASFIEFGTGPWALTPEQLNGYVQGMNPGSLLRFGRSGKAYLIAGPYIAPAMHSARHLTHGRMQRLMQELWA